MDLVSTPKTITNDFVPAESINYLDIEIPYFKNIRRPYHGFPKTLEFFIDKVKYNASIREDVLAGRSFGKGHPDYDFFKNNMPVIAPSVNYRNLNKDEENIKKVKANVSHLNGLWCVDIDVKEAEYDKYGKIVKESENINIDLKTILENDPYTLVSCKSFGGKGYTAFLYCDGIDLSNSLEFYFAIEQYFKDIYNIIIDPSRKNVNGLRYLTHDENIFYNPRPKHFSWDGINRDSIAIKNKTKPTTNSSVYFDDNSNSTLESKAEDWQRAISTIINYKTKLWSNYSECLLLAVCVPPLYFKQLCDKFPYKESWKLVGSNTVFKGGNLRRFKNLATQKGARFKNDEILKKKVEDIQPENETQKSTFFSGIKNFISSFNYLQYELGLGLIPKEKKIVLDGYLSNHKESLMKDLHNPNINVWDVPAGGGKTDFVIKASEGNRVLIAVPSVSIIKSNFENDKEFGKNFVFCYKGNPLVDNLTTSKSIVCTFDQLTLLTQYPDVEKNINYSDGSLDKIGFIFKYIFIDECHELMVNCYRIGVVGQLIELIKEYTKKRALKFNNGDYSLAPIILMTGTPLNENVVFGDMLKITSFTKNQSKHCEVVLCGTRAHTFETFITEAKQKIDAGYLVFIPSNKGERYCEVVADMLGVGKKNYSIFSKNQVTTEANKYILENHLIPEEINLLFGTSYAGCGLNFNNPDRKVAVMYLHNDEKHFKIAGFIEQYNARFRKVSVECYIYQFTLLGDVKNGYTIVDFGYEFGCHSELVFNRDLIQETDEKIGAEGAINVDLFGNDFKDVTSKKSGYKEFKETYSTLLQYEQVLKKRETFLMPFVGSLKRLEYNVEIKLSNVDHEKREYIILYKDLIDEWEDVKFKQYIDIFEVFKDYSTLDIKDFKWENCFSMEEKFDGYINEIAKGVVNPLFSWNELVGVNRDEKTIYVVNKSDVEFVNKWIKRFNNFDVMVDNRDAKLKFIREELFDVCLMNKYKLENRYTLYKMVESDEVVVRNLVDDLINYWFDGNEKSFKSGDGLKEWAGSMTKKYLNSGFFELLGKKVKKSELDKFFKLMYCFGKQEKNKKGIGFIFEKDFVDVGGYPKTIESLFGIFNEKKVKEIVTILKKRGSGTNGGRKTKTVYSLLKGDINKEYKSLMDFCEVHGFNYGTVRKKKVGVLFSYEKIVEI